MPQPMFYYTSMCQILILYLNDICDVIVIICCLVRHNILADETDGFHFLLQCDMPISGLGSFCMEPLKGAVIKEF